MLLSDCLIPLAVSVAISICSATKVLPRSCLPVVEFSGAAAIGEVTVDIDDRADAALRPRPGLPLQKHPIASDRSPEKIKRTLLGSRQNCNPGSNSCPTSAVCCPNDQECCRDGCSSPDGQCCTTCDAGLVCVQFNGRATCCENVSCSEYQGSGAPAISPSAPIATASFPPPSLTLDSVLHLSLSSAQTRSLPHKPSRPDRPAPTGVTVSSFNNVGTSATYVSYVGTSTTSLSSSNSVGTSEVGGGSVASAGAGPAGWAWAMGFTAAVMAVGVLL